VILHELAHVILPDHSEGFIGRLDQHMPNWQQVKKHLNDLPLAPVA
jgi:predicted metal-dependent hydrolase